VPTHANGQLAFGTYKLIDGEWLPNAIHLITLGRGGEIVDMIAFLDTSLFPRFGLPDVPPDTRNSD
jgi:RNA polymerase sigma-70 factor (ECF subfamily)